MKQDINNYTQILQNALECAAAPRVAQRVLFVSLISCPLGMLAAVSDTSNLYLLQFLDVGFLHKNLARIQKAHSCLIKLGRTPIIDRIKAELDAYFQKQITEFTVPLVFTGTPFQKDVWKQLCKIPYGSTCSYLHLAQAVSRPTAFRAAASANGANLFVVIVPCHRVINTGGALGGYSAGLDRKKQLLALESSSTDFCVKNKTVHQNSVLQYI